MFFSSATNVAAEQALRHTAINHQTFGSLSLARPPQLSLFLWRLSLGLELASMENGMLLTNDIQK